MMVKKETNIDCGQEKGCELWPVAKSDMNLLPSSSRGFSVTLLRVAFAFEEG